MGWRIAANCTGIMRTWEAIVSYFASVAHFSSSITTFSRFDANLLWTWCFCGSWLCFRQFRVLGQCGSPFFKYFATSKVKATLRQNSYEYKTLSFHFESRLKRIFLIHHNMPSIYLSFGLEVDTSDVRKTLQLSILTKNSIIRFAWCTYFLVRNYVKRVVSGWNQS